MGGFHFNADLLQPTLRLLNYSNIGKLSVNCKGELNCLRVIMLNKYCGMHVSFLGYYNHLNLRG